MELCYSLKDIANLAGIAPQAVSNWRKRDPRFPAPDYANADHSTILFKKETVEAYLEMRFTNLREFLKENK